MRHEGIASDIVGRFDLPTLRDFMRVLENFVQLCRDRLAELEGYESTNETARKQVERCFASGQIAAHLVRAGGLFDISVDTVAERLDIRRDTVALHCRHILREMAIADRRARDIEIMRLAWGGWTNITIAARMNLARETVSRIIRRELYAKRAS